MVRPLNWAGGARTDGRFGGVGRLLQGWRGLMGYEGGGRRWVRQGELMRVWTWAQGRAWMRSVFLYGVISGDREWGSRRRHQRHQRPL